MLTERTVVGEPSSVAYGHSVGSILAFAYVKPQAAVAECGFEAVVMGAPRKATVLSVAAYDPKNNLPRSDAR